MGLFDYEFQLEKIKAHKPPLQKLNALIDWEIFREPIETALYVEPKSNAGAKGYDKLTLKGSGDNNNLSSLPVH